MHRRLWDCKRTFASAPTLPSPGSSVSYLSLVSLQHLGPQKVEAEPKLLSLYAPRYFGRRAHSHLLGCSCVAICIRLQPPLLDGLSAPAVEEAPSVDKQVVDLVPVAWRKVGRGCIPGGFEGQCTRIRI